MDNANRAMALTVVTSRDHRELRRALRGVFASGPDSAIATQIRWHLDTTAEPGIRNGLSRLQRQGEDAGPERQRIVLVFVHGRTGADLGCGKVDRDRHDTRRLQLLSRRRTCVGPSPARDML